MVTFAKNIIRKLSMFVLGKQRARETPRTPFSSLSRGDLRTHMLVIGPPSPRILPMAQHVTLWPKGTTMADVRLLSYVTSPGISEHDLKARAEALGFTVDAVTSSHGTILIISKSGTAPEAVRKARVDAVVILKRMAAGLITGLKDGEPVITGLNA